MNTNAGKERKAWPRNKFMQNQLVHSCFKPKGTIVKVASLLFPLCRLINSWSQNALKILASGAYISVNVNIVKNFSPSLFQQTSVSGGKPTVISG